jgi:hypothetical protein
LVRQGGSLLASGIAFNVTLLFYYIHYPIVHHNKAHLGQ